MLYKPHIKIATLTVNEDILISLSFFIPFLISGPQLLTGTLINYLLIMGTKFVDKKNHLIITIMPSIAAILNGLVFGKFTMFLIFFLPFIWVGNFIFIKLIVCLRNHLSISLSIFLGLILKTFILYFSALIYFKFNLIPEVFLTTMGAFQLITGLLGEILYLLISFPTNIQSHGSPFSRG
jgi:hypothetical protein